IGVALGEKRAKGRHEGGRLSPSLIQQAAQQDPLLYQHNLNVLAAGSCDHQLLCSGSEQHRPTNFGSLSICLKHPRKNGTPGTAPHNHSSGIHIAREDRLGPKSLGQAQTTHVGALGNHSSGFVGLGQQEWPG
nr:hypothetical protein [Tanacetum cinerariifolium]